MNMSRSLANEAVASTVEPARFREMMATLPAGVAIISAFGERRRPCGMTCSSVCGVSLRPPTLLVCLRKGSPTLAATLHGSAFTVNLLHERASPLAQLFASGAPDRFDRVRWTDDAYAGGPHLPEGAHTVADCRVGRSVLVGDHVVVFGEVMRVSVLDNPNPLLYGLRDHWSLVPAPAPVEPGARHAGC